MPEPSSLSSTDTKFDSDDSALCSIMSSSGQLKQKTTKTETAQFDCARQSTMSSNDFTVGIDITLFGALQEVMGPMSEKRRTVLCFDQEEHQSLLCELLFGLIAYCRSDDNLNSEYCFDNTENSSTHEELAVYQKELLYTFEIRPIFITQKLIFDNSIIVLVEVEFDTRENPQHYVIL